MGRAGARKKPPPAPLFYLDPTDAFTTENLRLLGEAGRRGQRLATNPLYNGHMGDGHFSPLGCALWSRLVGARLALLLDSPRGPGGRSVLEGKC